MSNDHRHPLTVATELSSDRVCARLEAVICELHGTAVGYLSAWSLSRVTLHCAKRVHGTAHLAGNEPRCHTSSTGCIAQQFGRGVP